MDVNLEKLKKNETMGDIADYYRNQELNWEDEQTHKTSKRTTSPVHMHTDKNGKKTPVTELEDSHLINIIRFIERRAKEGVDVFRGGGSDPESFWIDTDVVYGKIAKKLLNYKAYKNELKRRKSWEK